MSRLVREEVTRSPWVDAWHLNRRSTWPPGVIAALQRRRRYAAKAARLGDTTDPRTGMTSSGCVTWRASAASRSLASAEARARSAVPASAQDPGPSRTPEVLERTGAPPAVLGPTSKRHPATRRGEAHQPSGEPLRRFEVLNRLDPYDPYDDFDRPAVEASATDHTGPTDQPNPAEAAGVDSDELVDAFVRSVEATGGRCHCVTGDVPDSLLDRLVADLEAWEIVFSGDADEGELAQRLRNRGAEVSAATPERAIAAAVGLNLVVAGIADSGSLVLDTSRKRGRLASLLPPVQICVVPVERLVATAADALQRLGDKDDMSQLPPSLTVVAGPDQASDARRQPLTRRTHRPDDLHVIVVRQAR